jgi:hypothetical protein
MPRYRFALSIAAAALVLRAAGSTAHATDVAVGASFDGDGLKEFHLAVREHFHVEEAAVTLCRSRQVSDEHLPVVFFIAREAKVRPEAVLELRVGGKSWFDVALHFGLRADIFCVEVEKPHGPPYGKAFGYYKKRRSEWAAIRLDDADLVTLVNVKFLSAHCGISADAIVERHQTDASFIKLSGRWSFEKARGGPKPSPAASAAGAAGGKPRAAGKPEGGAASSDKGPGKGGGGKGRGKGN